MATSKDYVPAKNNAFFNFQNSLVEVVVSNGAGWNIPAGDITDLQDAQAIYVPLYNAITNKQTRTTQQVDAHTNGRATFEAFIRGFVKEFLVNNSDISHDEKIAMGLNPDEGTRSPRSNIETQPYLLIKAIGGSRIRVECRVESDSNRPSRHPDSDGVEYAYTLNYPNSGDGENGSDAEAPAEGTQTNPPTKNFSTKARFNPS